MDVPRKDGNRRDWGAGILPARAEQRIMAEQGPRHHGWASPSSLRLFFFFSSSFFLSFFYTKVQKCWKCSQLLGWGGRREIRIKDFRVLRVAHSPVFDSVRVGGGLWDGRVPPKLAGFEPRRHALQCKVAT